MYAGTQVIIVAVFPPSVCENKTLTLICLMDSLFPHYSQYKYDMMVFHLSSNTIITKECPY